MATTAPPPSSNPSTSSSATSLPTPIIPPPSQPISQSVDIRAARPIPLNAAQEAQVRDIYYKNVRGYCGPEIREFATCATGRTFTIPIMCRQQRLAMNTCMNAHAGRDEEDRAREEWWRTIPDRQREKEEDAKWKREQLQKKRDWWGVDENGRPKADPATKDGRP